MVKKYTICPFCGTGCGLFVDIKDGKPVGVIPAKSHPVSKGALCIKGWKSFQFVNHPKRLRSPLMKQGNSFKKVSWNEAIKYAATKLREIRDKYGSDSIMVLSSAKCTNEENYLLQKFARAGIGTNNVDHCARLCHAPTVSGLINAFGSGAMTNSINEIYETGAIFVIGSNTTEQHPLIGSKIIEAVKSGTPLVVADPRELRLSRFAKVQLSHLPGTDVPLLNGLAHIIIRDEIYDKKFIEEKTEGFEDLVKGVEKYTPEYVSQITSVPVENLEKAAHIYAEADTAMIFYAMGITQHTSGTDNVMAVANLALLTGNVGKPGTGVNPLRGQNNVQGACDLGALPEYLPGYARVDVDERRKIWEEAWDKKLPDKPGITLTEAIPLMHEGKIKAAYIMAENPVLSDPHQEYTIEALKKLELLVVQDIFLTETAQYAHVVLPGTSWLEKDGSYTNTERRVQGFEAAIPPLEGVKKDYEIICEVSTKFGLPMHYESAKEIMDEINKYARIYGGMTWERITNGVGVQWPCYSPDHPGTPYLHSKKFTRGKGKFHAIDWKHPPGWRTEEFPFILTTGRSYFHWHTGTMTRKISILEREEPQNYIEINPEDAKELGIREHQRVKVTSPNGSVTAIVKYNKKLTQKTIFMPFHFTEDPANLLTLHNHDPVSYIPEFKVTPVKVEEIK